MLEILHNKNLIYNIYKHKQATWKMKQKLWLMTLDMLSSLSFLLSLCSHHPYLKSVFSDQFYLTTWFWGAKSKGGAVAAERKIPSAGFGWGWQQRPLLEGEKGRELWAFSPVPDFLSHSFSPWCYFEDLFIYY